MPSKSAASLQPILETPWCPKCGATRYVGCDFCTSCRIQFSQLIAMESPTREAHVAEERQVDVRRLRVQNRVRKPARGSSLAHAVPTPARARGSQLPRLVRAHARVSRVARLAMVHEKLAQLDAIRGLGVAPFGEPLGRAKRSKAGSGGIVLIRYHRRCPQSAPRDVFVSWDRGGGADICRWLSPRPTMTPDFFFHAQKHF